MRASFSLLPYVQRVATTLATAVLVVTIAGCATLQDWRDENKGIQLAMLTAAPGHKVTVLASGLPAARHMVMGSKGTLFV